MSIKKIDFQEKYLVFCILENKAYKNWNSEKWHSACLSENMNLEKCT